MRARGPRGAGRSAERSDPRRDGVREKFGVEPSDPRLPRAGRRLGGRLPGIPGIGKVTAARLLNRHGAIEEFPPAILGDNRDLALLFKDLATLRTERSSSADVDELRWRGPEHDVGIATRASALARPRAALGAWLAARLVAPLMPTG